MARLGSGQGVVLVRGSAGAGACDVGMAAGWSGGGWLRVQLEQPGVLLLRRLGPRRAEGVAVAMFGHTGLGMLSSRNEGLTVTQIYAPNSIITHGLLTLSAITAQPFLPSL